MYKFPNLGAKNLTLLPYVVCITRYLFYMPSALYAICAAIGLYFTCHMYSVSSVLYVICSIYVLNVICTINLLSVLNIIRIIRYLNYISPVQCHLCYNYVICTIWCLYYTIGPKCFLYYFSCLVYVFCSRCH